MSTSKKVSKTVSYLAVAGKKIGEVLAVCAKAIDGTKENATIEITTLLDSVIKSGFNWENDSGATYAPSKNKSGILYVPFAAAIGETISASSRDNRMSKIRAYLKANGTEPLDLFGNIAAKKMAEAKAENDGTEKTEATEKSAKSEKAVTMEMTPNFRGFSNMADAVAEFIVQNEPAKGAKKSPRMEMILGMCDDLLQELKAQIERDAK